MNVTEYIASGILESYVMGAVSDQERREVECLSSIYPDIRRELDQLSEVLEDYALLHSVEPPAAVRTKLLEQINFGKPEQETQETVVRPMPVQYSSSPTFRVSWVVAASMGLLVLLFSFYLLSQLRTNQKTLADVRTNNSTLQSELRQVREREFQDQERLAVLQRAGMRVIQLRGNEKAPNGDMLVYWNTQTKQISVDIKSLPKLPSNQQYQLWSMVGGKPVDAGVFNGPESSQLFQRLNRLVGKADAFAVTVEKRGGSPTPTLSTLLAVAPVNA